jgi:hypothetical protein
VRRHPCDHWASVASRNEPGPSPSEQLQVLAEYIAHYNGLHRGLLQQSPLNLGAVPDAIAEPDPMSLLRTEIINEYRVVA